MIEDSLPIKYSMLHLSKLMFNLFKPWLNYSIKIILMIIMFLGVSTTIWTYSSHASLPSGNAITDSQTLLRYALPINNLPIRKLQASLEDISRQLRANKRWGGVSQDIKQVSRILDKPSQILASVPLERQLQAKTWIKQLQSGVTDLEQLLKTRSKTEILATRNQLLGIVSDLEESMVSQFPYEVPSEYSNLPQLKGRATIDFTTSKGKLTVVVDGYSAPVTAGNFVDLVQRGFYNGLEFTRSEDSYVLQFGDPVGKEVGFIDPETGKYRAIPLEILAEGDKSPTYGITLEDAGRYLDMPVLPFSAFGALAMARPEGEANGGSSQVFFFLFEPELTPAGRNLLDGRYAIFGYLTDGEAVLRKLKAGDKIESATVVKGLENLVA
jgi:peptidylprolyl isomerase